MNIEERRKPEYSSLCNSDNSHEKTTVITTVRLYSKICHVGKLRGFLFVGVCVVFLILAAGNMSNLVKLHVSDHTELRIWLLICFAVLLPLSWLGTPKEFWGIAIGASVATAVACLMICICIVLDMPADLNSVEQPTLRFESFFSGMYQFNKKKTTTGLFLE